MSFVSKEAGLRGVGFPKTKENQVRSVSTETSKIAVVNWLVIP